MKSTEAGVSAEMLELFRGYGELEGGLSRTFRQVKTLATVFGMLGYESGDEIDVGLVAKTLHIPDSKLRSLLRETFAPVEEQEQGSPIRHVFRIPSAPVEIIANDDTNDPDSQWLRHLRQNGPKGRHQPPDDPTPRWS